MKGKEFNPDARMRKILTDAAAVGNAAGRVLNWRPRESLGWSYYPGSSWTNMLWQGGANFETPPPNADQGGLLQTVAADRCTHPGLIGFLDGDKNYFDGGKTYKVTLPPVGVRFKGGGVVSQQFDYNVSVS